MSGKHLWEIEHPYCCSEDNHFSDDCAQYFNRWCDFLEEEGDSDMDLNLVFRWDWEWPEKRSTDRYLRDGTLRIFFIGQRKGLFRSCTVDVCEADEDDVRKYLQPRLEHLLKLWAPLVPSQTEAPSDGAVEGGS